VKTSGEPEPAQAAEAGWEEKMETAPVRPQIPDSNGDLSELGISAFVRSKSASEYVAFASSFTLPVRTLPPQNPLCWAVVALRCSTFVPRAARLVGGLLVRPDPPSRLAHHFLSAQSPSDQSQPLHQQSELTKTNLSSTTTTASITPSDPRQVHFHLHIPKPTYIVVRSSAHFSVAPPKPQLPCQQSPTHLPHRLVWFLSPYFPRNTSS
jgi:hypothetical protein